VALTPTMPSRQPSIKAALLMLLLLIGCGFGSAVRAQITKDKVEAAKRALDLKLYQEATTDALVAQREAEVRKATAEAERAELLARLPSGTAKALDGATDTRQFGAAGLVKAFDLAQQLAVDVCSVLPADKKTVIHEVASTQGVIGARMVSESIGRMTDDMGRQNKQLQLFIDQHAPPGPPLIPGAVVALTVVPATIKAAADISSLFKTDVTVAGLGYGEGARAMFVSALGKMCPNKIVGFGSGYLGELDLAQHERLLGKVRALVTLRGDYAGRIAVVEQLAELAKGDAKRKLAAVAAAAGAALKLVDAFVDSLKAGETGEKSPLFNAARYLAYAGRTGDALVLDFDLRLEGMSIVKDNLFTGQHLRLSGVAFLWYRLYESNGALRSADAMRRITAPVDVDLRGKEADGEFWDRAPVRAGSRL